MQVVARFKEEFPKSAQLEFTEIVEITVQIYPVQKFEPRSSYRVLLGKVKSLERGVNEFRTLI